MLESMSTSSSFVAREWIDTLRAAALPIFDKEVMPGLADLGQTRRRKAIEARARLIDAFAGRPRFGKKIFDPLGLERSPKQVRK